MCTSGSMPASPQPTDLRGVPAQPSARKLHGWAPSTRGSAALRTGRTLSKCFGRTRRSLHHDWKVGTVEPSRGRHRSRSDSIGFGRPAMASCLSVRIPSCGRPLRTDGRLRVKWPRVGRRSLEVCRGALVVDVNGDQSRVAAHWAFGVGVGCSGMNAYRYIDPRTTPGIVACEGQGDVRGRTPGHAVELRCGGRCTVGAEFSGRGGFARHGQAASSRRPPRRGANRRVRGWPLLGFVPGACASIEEQPGVWWRKFEIGVNPTGAQGRVRGLPGR